MNNYRHRNRYHYPTQEQTNRYQYRYRFKLDTRAAIQHHRDLERHEQKLDRITQRIMEEEYASEYGGNYDG